MTKTGNKCSGKYMISCFSMLNEFSYKRYFIAFAKEKIWRYGVHTVNLQRFRAFHIT